MLDVREVTQAEDILQALRDARRRMESRPAETCDRDLRRAQALTRSVKAGMPSGSRSSGLFRKSGGMPAAHARR